MTSKQPQKELTTPLFSIDVNLSIPNVVLSPPLDELQQVLNKAARYIVEASKSVKAWGQHRVHLVDHEDELGNRSQSIEPIAKENLESWYSIIQNSKGNLLNHPFSETQNCWPWSYLFTAELGLYDS
jgi:hypothetical protein